MNTVKKTDTVTIGVDSGLQSTSLFNPLITLNHHIEMFKQLVLKDLENITPKNNIDPRYIQKGIQALEKRNNIIVRPADKGGQVVILDKQFYNSQFSGMLARQ